MAALAAVVGRQADADSLVGVCAHVQPHRCPVFPQHIVCRLVPAQIGVGDKVCRSAARVNQLVVLVQDLDAETGLLRRAVLGVLQHRRVFEDKQVERRGVDKQAVRHRLRLGVAVVRRPVAQTHRRLRAFGHGAQQAARAGVALRGVVMHRVAAQGALVAVIHNPHAAARIAVRAVGARGVLRRQVRRVDAARAACRGEDHDGVAIVPLAETAHADVAAGAEAELIVRQVVQPAHRQRRGCRVQRRPRAVGKAHGAVFHRDVGLSGLLPVQRDAVGRHARHLQVGGTAGGDIQIVQIEPVPAARSLRQAEGEEPRLGWCARQDGLHTLPSVVLCVGETFEGDERAGVVGVAHHAEVEDKRAVIVVPHPERHRQPRQTVHLQVGQHRQRRALGVGRAETQTAVGRMALVAVHIAVVAVFLRHTQFVPAQGQAVVLAGVEIHAQRNGQRTCLGGHLLQRDAGRRHRVAAEIEIVRRTVRQRQKGGETVDMHESPRPLFETRRSVLHPEARTRRLGSVNTHHVVAREDGTCICGNVAGEQLNPVNPDRAPVAVGLPHPQGDKTPMASIAFQPGLQHLPASVLIVAQRVHNDERVDVGHVRHHAHLKEHRLGVVRTPHRGAQGEVAEIVDVQLGQDSVGIQPVVNLETQVAGVRRVAVALDVQTAVVIVAHKASPTRGESPCAVAVVGKLLAIGHLHQPRGGDLGIRIAVGHHGRVASHIKVVGGVLFKPADDCRILGDMQQGVGRGNGVGEAVAAPHRVHGSLHDTGWTVLQPIVGGILRVDGCSHCSGTDKLDVGVRAG